MRIPVMKVWGEDEILEESIRYFIAASKGFTNMYPEGWDKNMKRADRVIVRSVNVVTRRKRQGRSLCCGTSPWPRPCHTYFRPGKDEGMPVQCAWTKESRTLSNFEGTEVQEDATTPEFLILG